MTIPDSILDATEHAALDRIERTMDATMVDLVKIKRERSRQRHRIWTSWDFEEWFSRYMVRKWVAALGTKRAARVKAMARRAYRRGFEIGIGKK